MSHTAQTAPEKPRLGKWPGCSLAAQFWEAPGTSVCMCVNLLITLGQASWREWNWHMTFPNRREERIIMIVYSCPRHAANHKSQWYLSSYIYLLMPARTSPKLIILRPVGEKTVLMGGEGRLGQIQHGYFKQCLYFCNFSLHNSACQCFQVPFNQCDTLPT